MTNSRRKGKTIENYFAQELRPVFPNVRRNFLTQTREGGSDFIGTNGFAFEVKGGRQCKSATVRGWLRQVSKEGSPTDWKVVLVKPDRESPYAIIPFADLVDMLSTMKNEGIIK